MCGTKTERRWRAGSDTDYMTVNIQGHTCSQLQHMQSYELQPQGQMSGPERSINPQVWQKKKADKMLLPAFLHLFLSGKQLWNFATASSHRRIIYLPICSIRESYLEGERRVPVHCGCRWWNLSRSLDTVQVWISCSCLLWPDHNNS